MKKTLYLVIILSFFMACKSQKSMTRAEQENQQIKDYLKEQKIKAKPQESGLYYVETQEGTGKQAKKGDKVKVHYTGKLMNGKKFDSSHDRGVPFEFTLGAGRVIKGWDEGIALMKEGGKATLIIPSELGYGSQEIPNVIPANSILLFDVELVEIK